MKTRKILAALCASFMAITAMAAQVSAEKSAETNTSGASAESSATFNVFEKGVWKFTSETGTVTYFVFNDATSGHTELADGLGGVPFACEQDGWNITFHFGGVDDTSKAVVSEGDASIAITYADGSTYTYSVEYIDGADPATFSAEDYENTFSGVFSKGVWLMTAEDSVDTYFIFYDETSGVTERADGTGGVPFSCEQDGWNILFHFGGADDNTKAVVSEGDASITFTYENGNTKTYLATYIDGADPETFDIDGFVPEDLYALDGADIALFAEGIWKYTVLPTEDHIVEKPNGYFRFNGDGTGYMMNEDGVGSNISIDLSDLTNVTISYDDYGIEGMVKVTYVGEGVIAADISADRNTVSYTFNYVPADEEDAFLAEYDKLVASRTGNVDAATDSDKGSPDTGIADVAAVAGIAVLAAGAFVTAKKRK